MAVAEHKSDNELTKDAPYLTLTGELWGVCCRDLGENWPHYNSTALYNSRTSQTDMLLQFRIIPSTI